MAAPGGGGRSPGGENSARPRKFFAGHV